LVLAAGTYRRNGDGVAPGLTAPAESDERGELVMRGDEISKVDPGIWRRALEISGKLALGRPILDRRPIRGIGDLSTVGWRGGSDDVDLDATLERIAVNPHPRDDDIRVREWVRRRRSVVLVIDISGSMRGERIRTAAATVGALAAELVRDRLAVVAFWSDAAVLVPLHERAEPVRVLELLTQMPARGLTNVGFALELAKRQLVGVVPRESRVLLLSDCVHNAGPDPRLEAVRLPRLDVLLDTSGECDIGLGRDLGRVGRGRCQLVQDYRDVAGALSAIFVE
jgi:Mg-chelatase subunit ChlD